MKDSDNSEVTKGQKGLSPYCAFNSFKTGVQVFKDQMVPDRIDRSVWGNKFSGSTTTQVLAAFRFLDLIDKDGVPKKRLRQLVDALGTSDWSSTLREVLLDAYKPIFVLDLEKVSPSQFNERFRDVYGAEGDTGRKCTTFFLNAAREAAIQVSSFLEVNTKPRSGGGRRKFRAKTTGGQGAPSDPNTPPPPPPPGDLTDKLLDKFPQFDPSWPDNIKESWFASFGELMDRTKSNGKDG